ncbi:SPFH domain-containing protein [Cellulomonas sp. SG140]|uniref:SPFH domain-containing protein n=1 Tax=Cellulomonas sp. SG140 TaxID=2976536 RepID=UPI0021E752CB|nr:SPFH domain-containing protein [Cellulomonas sp. SG140]
MFVLFIILAVLALIVLAVSFAVPKATDDDFPARKVTRVVAGALTALALVFGGFASLYTQSVGQASVLINAGGTISGQDTSPGFSAKAPWVKLSTWDLFSQSATYAGNKKGAPDYTRGQVNGQEVTSSVSGGAQVNFDLSVTYSIDGAKVEQLYREFRSQERFTKQVIEPQILAVVRDVPTSYKPVEFRGEKRGEATTRMLDALNKSLNSYGVTVSLVNLQNISFTDEVETSIKSVEVAQQKAAEADANLRAAQIDAQQKVVVAQAEADANRLLSESLTPQVLEQRRIEAMKAGTVFVVPEGSTPLVSLAGK